MTFAIIYRAPFSGAEGPSSDRCKFDGWYQSRKDAERIAEGMSSHYASLGFSEVTVVEGIKSIRGGGINK